MKIIYMGLGSIFLALGAVGLWIPILPTTPFLLLGSFCFMRGSEKIHKRLTQSKWYKHTLDDFLKKRAMTLQSKRRILAMASLMLFISFWMMKNIYGRLFILLLIGYKYYYFMVHIKTIDENEVKDIEK